MQLVIPESMEAGCIECPKCKWQGSASQLKKGDYFDLTQITEVFCPDCGNYIGFIQHDRPEGK